MPACSECSHTFHQNDLQQCNTGNHTLVTATNNETANLKFLNREYNISNLKKTADSLSERVKALEQSSSSTEIMNSNQISSSSEWLNGYNYYRHN